MKKNIFISCVSSEFETLRGKAVRILNDTQFNVIHQKNLPHKTGKDGKIPRKLREQIKSCIGVIQIVGDAYGGTFNTVEKKYKDKAYSITQMEYQMAVEMKKQIWLIFPGKDCFRDAPPEKLNWGPGEDPETATEHQWEQREERRKNQAAYKQRLLDQYIKEDQDHQQPRTNDEFEEAIGLLKTKDFARIVKQQRTMNALIAVACIAGLAASLVAAKFAIEKYSEHRAEQAEKNAKPKYGDTERAKAEENRRFSGLLSIRGSHSLTKNLTANSRDTLQALAPELRSSFRSEYNAANQRMSYKPEAVDYGKLRTDFDNKGSTPAVKRQMCLTLAGVSFDNLEFDAAAKMVTAAAKYSTTPADKQFDHRLVFEIRCHQMATVEETRIVEVIDMALSELAKLDPAEMAKLQEDLDDKATIERKTLAMAGTPPDLPEPSAATLPLPQLCEADYFFLLWQMGKLELQALKVKDVAVKGKGTLPAQAGIRTFEMLVACSTAYAEKGTSPFRGQESPRDSVGKAGKTLQKPAAGKTLVTASGKAINKDKTKLAGQISRISKCVGWLYAGRGEVGLAELERRNFDTTRKVEHLDQAIDHFFKAREFQREAAKEASLQQDALTEMGIILSKLSPSYTNWADNLFKSFADSLQKFETALNSAQNSASDENMEWQTGLEEACGLFAPDQKVWDTGWANFREAAKPFHEDSETASNELETSGEENNKVADVSRELRYIKQLLDDKIAKGNELEGRKTVLSTRAIGLLRKKAPEKKPVEEKIRDMTDLEECLRLTDISNSDGAKKCVAELEKLKKKAAGDPAKLQDSQDASELINLISELYLARVNYLNADAYIATADTIALHHQARAEDFSVPFGPNRRVRHDDVAREMAAARSVRINAQKSLEMATANVSEQLRRTAEAARNYNDKNQEVVVAALSGMAYAVRAETRPDDALDLPKTQEEVDEIKNRGKITEGKVTEK